MTPLTTYFLPILGDAFAPMASYAALLLVIGASSLILAHAYSLLNRQRFMARGSLQLMMPFMGLAVTSIFCTLQFSIPLSLGLLGSLSIVRFRNPIRDALDICFILLIIALSLLTATSNFVLLIALLFGTYVFVLAYRGKNNSTLLSKPSMPVLISVRMLEASYNSQNSSIEQKILDLLGDAFSLRSHTQEDQVHILNFSGVSDQIVDHQKISSAFAGTTQVNIYYEV